MYPITHDLDRVIADCDPLKLVTVSASPFFEGALFFDCLDAQTFFDEYKDWVSRYCTLSESFMLPRFVDALTKDGWDVHFLPSAKDILQAVERWSQPLSIDNLAIPGKGELFDFQTFGLNHALERATTGTTRDERFHFWSWGTGTGKSLAASAGALELFNRNLVDVCIAFTTKKLCINLCRYFQTTTPLVTVTNDKDAEKRKVAYKEPTTQVFVINYEKAFFDFDSLLNLVQGKRVLFVLDEVQKVLSEGRKTRARKSLEVLIQQTREAIIWPMSASVVSASPFRYRDVFDLTCNSGPTNPLGTKRDFEKRYVARKQIIPLSTRYGGRFEKILYIWDNAKLQEVRHRVVDRTQSVRKTDPGVRETFRGLQVIVVPVQLSAEDRKLYQIVKSLAKQAKDRDEDIMEHYRLLRVICNTPEGLKYSESTLAKQIALKHPNLCVSKNSSKMEMFVDQIEAIQEAEEKVIAFTKWTHLTLHRLIPVLKKRGIRFVEHHGELTDKQAQAAQDTFKQDPAITLFLSSDAGAYGLNFPEARHCIHYEVPYSYDIYVQRTNRIDRADSYLDGLTSYVYITENTLEEGIWDIMQQRRKLAEATLGTKEALSYGSESQTADYLIFGQE